MRSVALDLGAKKICYSEAKDERIVRRATVRHIDELVPLLGPNTPPARVALEACREAWAVHAKLTSWGKEPVLVDTTRSRQIGIGQHGRKSDRIDGDVLALALARGHIPKAHVLSPERQELRHHLAVRRSLVEARVNLVTTIRGLVNAHGMKVPGCDVETFVARLRATVLDEHVRALVTPLVDTVEHLNGQLAIAERKLHQLGAREPVIQQLCTAPGVSLIVAAAFVSVIDDAGRFTRAHQVESYLGLVPLEDTTGGRQRLGHITKQGNSYLRAMLVQAAWCVLNQRKPDPLTQWGHAVAARRGKRIAVVAVARRLAGVLWAMWRKDTVYDPALLGHASAKGLETQAQSTAVRAAAMKQAACKLARRLSQTQPKTPKKGANAA